MAPKEEKTKKGESLCYGALSVTSVENGLRIVPAVERSCTTTDIEELQCFTTNIHAGCNTFT